MDKPSGNGDSSAAAIGNAADCSARPADGGSVFACVAAGGSAGGKTASMIPIYPPSPGQGAEPAIAADAEAQGWIAIERAQPLAEQWVLAKDKKNWVQNLAREDHVVFETACGKNMYLRTHVRTHTLTHSICTSTRACTRKHTNIHIHTHKHTHTRKRTHTQTHTQTHTNTNTDTHINTHTYTHTHTHNTHTHTHTHKHTCTHTHKHTRTHTNTHSHTHT